MRFLAGGSDGQVELGNWAPTVSGPLTEYAPGYQRWLIERGFTPQAKGVAARMWQLGQLSRWLEAEKLAPGQLTSEHVARNLKILGTLGLLVC